MKKNTVILKSEKEKAIRKGHPWMFSGAIKAVKGEPGIGETVDVMASTGELIGRAAFSPISKIRARMWSWGDEEIDPDFFKLRIQRAIELRQSLGLFDKTSAVRLLHAESDGLPGVIVDQYGDTLILQLLTAGAEYWKTTVVELLADLTGAARIFERSDVEVRRLEGLPARVGVLFGDLPDDLIQIEENGLKFWVNVKSGQKTGFYLDQRNNRQQVREQASGRSILNCFCYTGAFSVYALTGNAASVHSVESSADSIALAKQNLEINSLPAEKATWEEGDVFAVLRTMRDRAQSFDMIILDPPKFAPTIAQAKQAARGYKDINLLAFKLLNPGGLLYTFSCSGGISEELFQKIVAGAAEDAKKDARIVARLSQGPDHPVALRFPEGAYLKGLVCQA